MNFFSKNLDYLTKTKINQSQLAEKLELSRQCISGYLKQGKEPKYNILIKISEIFNVSIDDLLKKNLSKEV